MRAHLMLQAYDYEWWHMRGEWKQYEVLEWPNASIIFIKHQSVQYVYI